MQLATPTLITVARCFVLVVASLLAALGSLPSTLAAEPKADHFAELAEEYVTHTRPLLQQFCLKCHSTAKRKGELDLERFATLAEVRRGTKAWLKVVEMLDNGEMPPKESKLPSPEQRKHLRGWAERYLHAEALARAGDPGPVVLRRLNNAEYTYTMRDLTGVDLNPAREFPTDSAAGEGFTNTGNALTMSPALLTKYLDAGKELARHALLLPDGFLFSPHTTQRDWTDEVLAQIRGLYREFVDPVDLGVGSMVGNINVHGDTRLGQAGRLPLEKYLAATLAERDALATGDKTIEAVARDRGLNAKYLGILWSSLTGAEPSLLLDGLRARWRGAKPEDAVALTADVAAWQTGLWTFNPVGLIGRKGSRPRWMEPVNPLMSQQDLRIKMPMPAEGTKEVVVSLVASDAGDGNDHDFIVWQQPRLVADKQPDILLRDVTGIAGLDPAMFGKHANGSKIDADSLCVHAPSVITLRLPADVAAGREFVTTAVLHKETGSEGSVQPDVVAGVPTNVSGLLPSTVSVTLSQVTALFPEHRTVSFARPVLVAESSAARKRFESAMHAHRNLFPAALCYAQIVPVDEVLTLTLFYREDDHLVRLMLDDSRKARLDRLWGELRYISHDALKVADVLDSLVETTKDHPQAGAFDSLIAPFHQRAAKFRKQLLDAEPKHIDAIVDFAARAYRRPLDDKEANELRELYGQLREQELPHDEAFRLTLARVFIASPFLYRLEDAPQGTAAAPVSDWELASRLSYFLWSSQPDEELRAVAAEATLHQSDVLAKQTQRMLKDARVRRLATEFACQWLHIHEFDAVAEKSEKHFPEFADLRGDMHEESILFFTDLFQRDASVLSLLNADHTFVNERLAKFYGIPVGQASRLPDAAGSNQPATQREASETLALRNGWRRIDGIQQHGRGGILGLSATLAKQSGASRTSPILRGNWVSEVLLGEKLPRPPKNVPQLADKVPEGLTERQLIEKHSSDAACAKCHQRIDPFGFALEGFDAIGRRRDTDLAGRPIDRKTKLPDGSEINGLAGLRDYLLETRRDAVLRQFCRKLLGYALGRELQLSDEPLLTEMQQRLAKNDYRFSVAVELIVQSRQFREIRGSERPNDQ